MPCDCTVETSGVNSESYVLFLSSELHDGLALLPDLVAQLLIGMPAHTQHPLTVTHYMYHENKNSWKSFSLNK